MASFKSYSDILEAGYKEEAVVLSRDLKVLYASDTYLQVNDLKLKDIKGKSCHEVLKSCMGFCKELSEECPVHESLTTGDPVSVTHQDVMINSTPHHFKIDIYPVTGKEPDETYFLHVTRDITNRIQEERLKDDMWMEILSRMESLYAAMVEGSENIEHIQSEIDQLIEIVPLAVVGWDGTGRLNRWNSYAEVLFGRPAQEVMGKSFIDYFASGASQEKFANILNKMQVGQTQEYSLAENRTATGHIITCEWYHNAFVLDSKKEMIGGLSLGQDVTERINTEKELGRSTAQLGAILNATSDAIVGINNLGRIIMWNPSAEKLFGWLAKEIRGREVEALLPAELRSTQALKIRNFFVDNQSKSGAKITFETLALRRDGTSIPVEATLSSAVIEDKLSGFAVFHDITERKRTENILVQSEKMRSLGEMASSVAHDFNNNLTTILGNIKLLKDTGVDEAVIDKLEAIEMAAQQGVTTISNLQGFSSPAGTGKKQFQLLALKPLIEEVRELTRFRWKDLPQKDGYTIEFTTELEDTPSLLINGPEFKEMLTNLIFNAVDAMTKGGHIHLSAKTDDNRAIISIQDNGVGMTADETTHIFDAYFTTKERGHAGLGLSIAKRFVDHHGGTIMVESVKGAGTTFMVEFPQLTTTDPEKLPSKQTTSINLKILVIDDEPLVRSLLKKVLENGGHTVAEAADGREGVRNFREDTFDLVITDHGMPVMNGLDAAFRIKKQSPHTPVLLITGWDTESTTPFQKPSGIDELISKPFDLENILDLVQEYARKIKQQ
jgi:PAS domain S-box-containing protein